MSDAEALARFEAALDPARPEASPGVSVMGCGEVSTVLALAALPGRVCKRMAGFADAAAAERYAAVVRRYVGLVGDAGVSVAATDVIPIERPGRAPVVYLLQPALDPKGLGNALVRDAGDAALARAIDAVLARVGPLLRANRDRSDGRCVTVDAQLSNWHFDAAGTPTLIDVGTPFMRRDGVDEIGVDLFYAPMPPGLRGIYRRLRAVERYLDAFFSPRGLLVDAIANFHKEGRPDRIPLALARVNRWLAEEVADLDAGAGRPVERADVDRYYARDAKTLELYLRARRLDRWVRTRLLRRRYDFVLPGAIAR